MQTTAISDRKPALSPTLGSAAQPAQLPTEAANHITDPLIPLNSGSNESDALQPASVHNQQTRSVQQLQHTDLSATLSSAEQPAELVSEAANHIADPLTPLNPGSNESDAVQPVCAHNQQTRSVEQLQQTAVSASLGNAEQPAQLTTDAANHSAEPLIPLNPGSNESDAVQPASDHKQQTESVQQLQQITEWLGTLSKNTVDNNEPLTRLQTATHLLQMRSCRDQRDKIQEIAREWQVVQKHKGQKRKFGEVKADLVASLAQEAKRLQTMQNRTLPLQTASESGTLRFQFSAIQDSLLGN